MSMASTASRDWVDRHFETRTTSAAKAFTVSRPIYSYDNGVTWTSKRRKTSKNGSSLVVTDVDRERGIVVVNVSPTVKPTVYDQARKPVEPKRKKRAGKAKR